MEFIITGLVHFVRWVQDTEFVTGIRHFESLFRHDEIAAAHVAVKNLRENISIFKSMRKSINMWNFATGNSKDHLSVQEPTAAPKPTKLQGFFSTTSSLLLSSAFSRILKLIKVVLEIWSKTDAARKAAIVAKTAIDIASGGFIMVGFWCIVAFAINYLFESLFAYEQKFFTKLATTTNIIKKCDENHTQILTLLQDNTQFSHLTILQSFRDYNDIHQGYREAFSNSNQTNKLFRRTPDIIYRARSFAFTFFKVSIIITVDFLTNFLYEKSNPFEAYGLIVGTFHGTIAAYQNKEKTATELRFYSAKHKILGNDDIVNVGVDKTDDEITNDLCNNTNNMTTNLQNKALEYEALVATLKWFKKPDMSMLPTQPEYTYDATILNAVYGRIVGYQQQQQQQQPIAPNLPEPAPPITNFEFEDIFKLIKIKCAINHKQSNKANGFAKNLGNSFLGEIKDLRRVPPATVLFYDKTILNQIHPEADAELSPPTTFLDNLTRPFRALINHDFLRGY